MLMTGLFSSAVSVWNSNSAVSKTPVKGMTAMATVSCPNCSARCCCCITWVICWPLHFRIDGVFVNSQLICSADVAAVELIETDTSSFVFLMMVPDCFCLDKYCWCNLIRILLWEGCKLTGSGRMTVARWLKRGSKLPVQVPVMHSP